MTTGPESGVSSERGAARWVLKGEVSAVDIAGLREIVLKFSETQQALLINCTSATYFETAALQSLANLRIEARALGVSLQIEGLPGSVLADAMPRRITLDERLAG